MILTTHRTWEDWLEDWLGAGLRLVAGVTPWLVGDTTDANIHS